MISVNNLSVHFSGNYLFSNISFLINERDKIGLVGKNGSGKTTLLRIIAGMTSPEKGEVVIPSGISIGYLQQEMTVDSTRSVFNEAITAFDRILEMKGQIDELTDQISTRDDYHSREYQDLIHQLSEADDLYRTLGGEQMHADTEKVLTGLGFLREDFHRPIQEFSYGWQMRVELAKILLARPNLLLLDEPTNHLDIESIQWVEEFLKDYQGAVILVSHDRAFLDNITYRTIEISDQKIYDYKASYSDYIVMREERLEKQIATFNNQQKQIKQIERFIERFRYKNTKARQVQSRIKALNKMEKIEIDEIDNSTFNFRFPPAPRGGKITAESQELSKHYNGYKVLDKINISIINKDKVAFVGRNGEGKTTLSKILAGKLDHQGIIKYGHNIIIGYYAQDQAEMLDQDKTVFETIDDVAKGDMRPKVRNLLGSFLFSGEDVDKKVKVLSGGEKSRLALARMLLTPVNFLILDEPTNHLDMQSKDILKSALLQYDGTLIIVSHDRDFLQGLTKKVFEFRNRKIREHLGDIYDFLRSRRLRHLNDLEEKKRNNRNVQKPPSKSKSLWEKNKQLDKEYRKIQSQIRNIEKEISLLEKEKEFMDAILSDPLNNKKKIEEENIYLSYDELNAELTDKMWHWEELHTSLEKVENEKMKLNK